MTEGTEHDAVVTAFASRARRQQAAASAAGDDRLDSTEAGGGASDETPSATVIGFGDARMARRRDTVASDRVDEPSAPAEDPGAAPASAGAPSARRGWATLREDDPSARHPVHGRAAAQERRGQAAQGDRAAEAGSAPDGMLPRPATAPGPTAPAAGASSPDPAGGAPVSPWLRMQRGRDASPDAEPRARLERRGRSLPTHRSTSTTPTTDAADPRPGRAAAEGPAGAGGRDASAATTPSSPWSEGSAIVDGAEPDAPGRGDAGASSPVPRRSSERRGASGETEPPAAAADEARRSTPETGSAGPRFPRAWNIPMQEMRPEADGSRPAGADRPSDGNGDDGEGRRRTGRPGERTRTTIEKSADAAAGTGDDGSEAAAAVAADAEQALLAALRRKELSAAEARAVLDRFDGLDPASAEEIIARFHDYGYLDDARVAETIVESLSTRKRMGESAIARELRGRGLDDLTVQTALASVDRDDEFERADELARDRARRLHGLDPDTAMRRLVSFLVRRGFGQGIAMTAAAKALEHDEGGGVSSRMAASGGFGRSGSSLGGRSSFGRRTWTRDDDPSAGRRAESTKRVYFGNDGEGEPSA